MAQVVCAVPIQFGASTMEFMDYYVDKKLNVNKPCVTSQKQHFESFAKFSVNFQDVTSFGEILKKLNANFGKILRKEKIH